MRRPKLKTQSKVLLARPLSRPLCPSQLPLHQLALRRFQPQHLLQPWHLTLAQQCPQW